MTYHNDFWEWDQPTNTPWSQKASFAGSARTYAVAFSIGNYGYIGTGTSSTPGSLSDMWQYNPIADSWSQVASYGGGGTESSDAFVIGCKGYVGLGYVYVNTVSVTAKNDFWEFEPPLPSAAISGNIVICEGDTTSLFASGGLFFQWSNCGSNNSIQVNPTVITSYSVIVSDVCGADTSFVTVSVNPSPIINITFYPDLRGSGLVVFTDSSVYAATWNWNFGDGRPGSSETR